MKTVSLVTSKLYQNNIIFDREQSKVKIRDNAFDKYYELYDEFKRAGINISTNDINTVNESDYVIYIDMPKSMPSEKDRNRSNLILMESPLIRPDNFDVDNHRYFNKIFTWDDSLVDGEKYIKINCAFKIPEKIPVDIDKIKFLCLIIGNKSSNHINELYTERKNLIRWFEDNHPDDFDLFGAGWNEYTFHGARMLRALNKIPFAKKVMYKLVGEYYPSYKGKVDSKFETMKKYRFSICYENIKNASGYITEKMLDAFFAASVPVYLGADNVTEHVPANCFIDRRDFDTDKDLYRFLKKMDDKTHLNYLNNIEDFLASDRGKLFSSQYFAKTVVHNILK